MATSQDYLSAIKAIYPNVKVDDGLMAELDRRAGENADPNSVVHDAASYYQVDQGNRDAATQQAAAQVDPVLAATKADLSNEQQVANTSAQRLQDSISKVYANKRMNDPLARQGIVSGAQQNYQYGQEADQTKQVGQDLSDKLSYIAKQLTNADTGAATQKAALTSSYLSGYGKDSQSSLQAAIASQQAEERQKAAQEQQAFDNQLALANLDNSTYSAHKAPSSDSSGLDIGSILSLLGGGSPPSGNGSSPPKASTNTIDDIKSEFQRQFQSGGGNGGNDQAIIQSFAQENPQFSPQQITDLFYQTRKPYEKPQTGVKVAPANDRRSVVVR